LQVNPVARHRHPKRLLLGLPNSPRRSALCAVIQLSGGNDEILHSVDMLIVQGLVDGAKIPISGPTHRLRGGEIYKPAAIPSLILPFNPPK